MPTTPVPRTTRHPLARPAVPRRVGLALLAVLAAGAALGPSAWAAAPCHVPGTYATLQAALNDATCALINVAAGTYDESAALEITRDVTIRGEGQDRTVIKDLVLQNDLGKTMTITGVTMQGKPPAFPTAFLSAFINDGTLTLRNSTVTGYTGGPGGGLYNIGTLTVTNSTITGNTAIGVDGGQGGGIHNESGTVTVTNSTITGNTADLGTGGGLWNLLGTLTLTNSTIAGNTAIFGGGGLVNTDGTATLTNSTIAGNTAGFGIGGGLYNDGTLTLTNSTVTGNTVGRDGGGLFNQIRGTATLQNSTVTGNEADGAGDDIFNQGTLTLTRVTVDACVDVPPDGTGCPAP